MTDSFSINMQASYRQDRSLVGLGRGVYDLWLRDRAGSVSLGSGGYAYGTRSADTNDLVELPHVRRGTHTDDDGHARVVLAHATADRLRRSKVMTPELLMIWSNCVTEHEVGRAAHVASVVAPLEREWAESLQWGHESQSEIDARRKLLTRRADLAYQSVHSPESMFFARTKRGAPPIARLELVENCEPVPEHDVQRLGNGAVAGGSNAEILKLLLEQRDRIATLEAQLASKSKSKG